MGAAGSHRRLRRRRSARPVAAPAYLIRHLGGDHLRGGAGDQGAGRGRSSGSTWTEIGDDRVSEAWGGHVTRQRAGRPARLHRRCVIAYLAIRFELRMAVAVVSGLVMDMVVAAGVYAPGRVRGDAGHGDRIPHHHGLRPLRRRSSSSTRCRRTPRTSPRATTDVRRGREPRRQPEHDALDQHLDRGAAAGRRSAVHRRRHAGRRHPQGPGSGAVRRHGGLSSTPRCSSPRRCWWSSSCGEPRFRAHTQRVLAKRAALAHRDARKPPEEERSVPAGRRPLLAARLDPSWPSSPVRRRRSALVRQGRASGRKRLGGGRPERRSRWRC